MSKKNKEIEFWGVVPKEHIPVDKLMPDDYYLFKSIYCGGMVLSPRYSLDELIEDTRETGLVGKYVFFSFVLDAAALRTLMFNTFSEDYDREMIEVLVKNSFEMELS